MKNKTTSFLTLFIASFWILLNSGCISYYKTLEAPLNSSHEKVQLTKNLNDANRYFILRTNDMSFHMTNVVVSENNIICTLDTISNWHKNFLGDKKRKQTYEKRPREFSILNEVHYFMKQDSTLSLGLNTIDLQKIQQVKIIEKDKDKTARSHAIAALIGITGTALILGVIGAAAMSAMW